MINGYVNGQVLRVSQRRIVAGTIDYLTASFSFISEDWNDLDKWVHFTKGDAGYAFLLKQNAIERNDHLNLSDGEWDIYIHGSSKDGMRITTNVCSILVERTGDFNGGEPLPELPLSVAEQIQLTASHALRVAESVRNDADSGVFNGADGKDGSPGVNGVDGVAPLLRVNTVSNEWEVSYDGGSQCSSSGVRATGDRGEPGENGRDGRDGADGVDGITPRMRINGATNKWEVSYDNGDHWDSLGVQATGDRGESGRDGNDGYTPQRGVDYWTPADIAEIKAYVDGQFGGMDAALDGIIALQESLIGGDA